MIIFTRLRKILIALPLEVDIFPASPALLPLAKDLQSALIALQTPMKALAKLFMDRLQSAQRDPSDHDEDTPRLPADTRKRLESVAQGLLHRADMTLQAWIDMLSLLPSPEASNDPHFVDWAELTRVDGRAVDLGLFRHCVDPMEAFAQTLKPHVQGTVMTSATLRDQEDWAHAHTRSGSAYLAPELGSQDLSVQSPFDYAKQSRIVIIDDVNKQDARQVAAAMSKLFTAAGGGGLGLFTAINRLRTIYSLMQPAMQAADLPLLAQHIDAMDTGTLIDMFRYDAQSCLLGTDATRDGVDVPGDSLRLLVYDRTPWPRPTLLHRARRAHFGGRRYDESMTRHKLKQAYGRLIRRADDRGVLVMLDPGLPSRLHDAFPEDVEVEKIGLDAACQQIKAFLALS